MNKYLILVNKNNKMNDESIYTKVKADSKYNDNVYIEKETYEAFLKLKDFVKEKGYIIDIESAYRSKEHQQRVWDETLNEKGLEHTKKYVAPPGYSEHQTGLAVDFTLYENGRFYIDHDMNGHPVLDIVKDNLYKFGFILRYPLGKEEITGYNFEPWHLRYIKDKEIAKYIYDNNLCLEEYLNEKGRNN